MMTVVQSLLRLTRPLQQQSIKVGMIVLGLIMLVGVSMPFQTASAQLGPNPKPQKPEAKRPTMADIKQSVSKLFTPQEEGAQTPTTEEVQVKRGAGMPGQFDTVTVKQPVGQGQNEESPKSQPVLQRPKLLEQPPLENAKVEEPKVSPENPPPKMPSLENESNPMGIAHARKKLNETAVLIEKKEYASAKVKLEPLKDWLAQATEAHIALHKVLSSLPNAMAQSELEKQVALEFAKMRDKAFLQMGQLLVESGQHRPAIPVLVEVVKSQPRGEVGVKAYELLQKIGFTQQLQLIE